MAELTTLGRDEAAVLGAICEIIVPGSARVDPAAYIDAAASGWPPGQRAALRSVLAGWSGVTAGGEDFVRERAATPEFAWLRALAIEAFYSDWAPPGFTGQRAWEQIGFDNPLARRLAKDFSYLRDPP